jgi:hypothetical protein
VEVQSADPRCTGLLTSRRAPKGRLRPKTELEARLSGDAFCRRSITLTLHRGLSFFGRFLSGNWYYFWISRFPSRGSISTEWIETQCARARYWEDVRHCRQFEKLSGVHFNDSPFSLVGSNPPMDVLGHAATPEPARMSRFFDAKPLTEYARTILARAKQNRTSCLYATQTLCSENRTI